jgi:hypothetical protein
MSTVYHIHNQLTGQTEVFTDWTAAQLRRDEIRTAYHLSIERAFQVVAYTEIGEGRHFISPVDDQGNPTMSPEDFEDPGPVEDTVQIITGTLDPVPVSEPLPSEPVTPP